MEDERLRSLIATGLLDTEAEERFDRLTRLARNALGTRIALISLVDADRQWFKSRIGIDACETSRDVSFCSHAIEVPDDVMVVLDARQDDRFRDNPLVTGDPNIGFYAGAPLVTKSGHAIGTLCVLDTEARNEFGDSQRAILKDLAGAAMTEIEAAAIERDFGDLQTVNDELRHRMGNLYAQVSGAVSLLGRSEADVKTFMIKLTENIRTMARIQSLFAANLYRPVPFAELVKNALSPFGEAVSSGRIEIVDDSELVVSERAAFLLTMVLNELATNATKHGALSSDSGMIRLRTSQDQSVTIDWHEEFASAAAPEVSKAGFGSRILRDIAPRGLNGTATFDLKPEGLHYSLSADPRLFEAMQ